MVIGRSWSWGSRRIRYAIGASLVSVIATSCARCAAYYEGYTVRVGKFLEVATTPAFDRALAGGHIWLVHRRSFRVLLVSAL